MSKPLVSPAKCAKCVYRSGGEGKGYHCGYELITGHTRTALHPEGLTSTCYEFKQRQRKHKYQAPIK